MRMFTLVSLVAVGLGLALVGGESAYARTPTPTATPTATSTPTPTPWPTPTPTLPPEQVAKFSGEAWLDAFGGYDRAGSVTAKIGDTVCGQSFFLCDSPPCLHIPVDPPPKMLPYALDVVPAEVKPGCGYEGAPVTFFVGDKQASQTAVWHAGGSQVINLAGLPFSFFQGGLEVPDELAPLLTGMSQLQMYPFIGSNRCGQAVAGGPPNEPGFEATAYSDQQVAGCGMEGSEVTFKLFDMQGNLVAVAQEKGVWHAWDGGWQGQHLNLTMISVGGIKAGNVGTGGSQERGILWRELSLVLAAVGLGGFAAGVALRKRAWRRPSA